MAFPVVILSFNKPTLTATCISSVLDLQRATGVQAPIIVVHNGSDENNIAFLRRHFLNVQHIHLSPNRGFSGGANAGLDEAFKISRWALFLSNDVTLLSWPEEPAPSVGILGPVIFRRSSSRVDSAGGIFDPASGRLRHCYTTSEFTGALAKDDRAHPYIPGSVFLMSRSCFTATGGFDESLGTYWEDVDLSVRAAKAGFELAVSPDWTARHGIGKTCHDDSLYTIYYFHRNRVRVSLKYTARWKQGLVALKLMKHPSRLMVKLMKSGRVQDAHLLTRALKEGFFQDRKVLFKKTI